MSASRHPTFSGHRLVLVSIALSAWASSAWSADPTRGATLYTATSPTACSACHGTNIAANQSKIKNGANNASLIQAAINGNTGGMGMYKTTLTAADVADIAAYLSSHVGAYATLSASSLSMASTNVGSTSSQSLTLNNMGTAALTITSVGLSGGQAADYALASSSTCKASASVAAGGSCMLTLNFTPTAAGTRAATVSILQNAAPSTTLTVTASGTATAPPAPAVQLSSANLAMGSVTVGSTSSTQTLTLTNSGNASLSLSSLSTTSTDFATNGGSCMAGGSVAAGASCTVGLVFTPSASGARSGSLNIATNAAGSPAVVALSGTGVATSPAISASPTSLSFSQTVGTTGTAQNITVSNTGTAALILSNLAISGAASADFALASGGTCASGGSVAAGSSCVAKVAFTPSAVGARNAALVITHNATGGSTSVTLAGTGSAQPQATIALSASTLSFPATVLGQSSATQTITVSNSGAAALSLSGLTLSGTALADFTRTGTCATGSSLAVGASCTVILQFKPTATGARTATLSVASNASNGTVAINLQGSGNPVPTPQAALTSTTLAFGSQTVGTTSTQQTTITNAGTANLTLGTLSVSGAQAAEFTSAGTCAAGVSVAPGGSCTLSVAFTPAGLGSRSASVSVTHSAAGSPLSLSVSGTGVAVPLPVAVWLGGITSASLPAATVGATATTSTITLVNNGPGALTLRQMGFAGAQASEFAVQGGSCAVGSTVAVGGSCSVVLSFQPSSSGSRAASFQLQTSGTDPSVLSLSGNATDPVAVSVSTGATPSSVAASALSNGEALYLGSKAVACSNCHGVDVSRDASHILNGSNTSAITNAIAAGVGGMGMYQGVFSAQDIADMSNYIGNYQAAKAQGLASTTVSSSTTTKAQNAGGGGCSIGKPGRPADPVWPLMVGAAVAALAWRKRQQVRA
jgi:mono/diheme cytochrome c family protein